MSAIPIPDAAPSIALPSDDEQLRRIMATTGAESIIPKVASNRGIPVTPQTQGKAIPVDRATGQVEQLNNEGKPIAPGIAGLWAHAENIQNPFLRTLGKIGAVGARALDVAGSVAAPGVMAQIPGTALNQKVEENRAARQEKADTENQASQARTAYEQAETSKVPTDIEYTKAETEALENPQAKAEKPEDLQQRYADAVGEVISKGGDPSTDPTVQKYADSITSLQKQTTKQTPAHITYDQGIPVSVTSQEGQTYDINDPKLPPDLKPLVDSANRAHRQHETEADTRQARTFAQQQKMFDARQDALTTTTKTMVEAAPKVLALAQRVNTMIDQQAAQLGPAAGRWSEFMAGKVGAPNPEFTRLRTDVGLLQTLLMRMHVGSRGGEYIMKHFQDLIDTGKQSPENLKAALGEITNYANDVLREGQQHGVGGGGTPQNNSGSPNNPLNLPGF